MPLYRVSVEFEMVVEAENETDAHLIAARNASEAVSECYAMIAVFGVIKHSVELPDGWDDMCIPYGGDERIKDILGD